MQEAFTIVFKKIKLNPKNVFILKKIVKKVGNDNDY